MAESVPDGPVSVFADSVRIPADRLAQPLMRLSRTSLLGRLAGAHAPRVVVLEAPTGYGKSWLIRKAAPVGVLRLRGELGPLAEPVVPSDLDTVVIDDAHLLDVDAVDRLVDRIEETETLRLIVAGRILPDAVHEVTQLVDGLIVDATALAVTAPEVVDYVPDRSATIATRVVEAADGCVRIIATALDQAMREPGADPIALASRMVRAANSAALATSRHPRQRGHRPARPGAGHRSPAPRSARRARVRRTGARRRRAAAATPHRRSRPGHGGLVPVGRGRAGGRRPPRGRARRARSAHRGDRSAPRRRRPRRSRARWSWT